VCSSSCIRNHNPQACKFSKHLQRCRKVGVLIELHWNRKVPAKNAATYVVVGPTSSNYSWHKHHNFARCMRTRWTLQDGECTTKKDCNHPSTAPVDSIATSAIYQTATQPTRDSLLVSDDRFTIKAHANHGEPWTAVTSVWLCIDNMSYNRRISLLESPSLLYPHPPQPLNQIPRRTATQSAQNCTYPPPCIVRGRSERLGEDLGSEERICSHHSNRPYTRNRQRLHIIRCICTRERKRR
jgi:hypothetical protein